MAVPNTFTSGTVISAADVNANFAAVPTSADLAASTGAGLIGTTESITAQAAITARAKSSDLAASTGAGLIGMAGGGSVESKLGSLAGNIVFEDGPLGKNQINNSTVNDIPTDVSGSYVAAGTPTHPNLIGYLQNQDQFTGDNVTTVFTTTFDVASTGDIKPTLIRADGVRVDLDSISPTPYTPAIVGGKYQITYPKAGHYVNDGTGGSEGSNPAILTTQSLILRQRSATIQANCGSDYSGIYGGYDNILRGGIMSHILGAHCRINTFGLVGASNGDHNIIWGGSYHTIATGYYGGIFAGTNNSITTTTAQGAAIIGGSGNTASGSRSGIFVSSSSTASGTGAMIVGGSLSTASGNGAIVLGRTNTASGQDTVTGGNINSNGGPFSTVFGLSCTLTGGGYAMVAGRSLTVSGQYAAAFGFTHTVAGNGALVSGYDAKAPLAVSQVIGGAQFAANGDAQSTVIVMKRQTTNNTVTDLRAGSASQRLVIPSDTTWGFIAYVTARRTDADNESAFYEIKGCIDNNAGTVALVGTVTVTSIAEDTAAWDATAVADNTNKSLNINVTGEAAKTINWVARVTLVEVTG